LERAKKEEEDGEMKVKRTKVEEKRLTGRQLWERGLVGKGEDVIEEEDGVVDGIEKLKVEV